MSVILSKTTVLMSKQDLANLIVASIAGTEDKETRSRIRQNYIDMLEDQDVIEALIKAGSK